MFDHLSNYMKELKCSSTYKKLLAKHWHIANRSPYMSDLLETRMYVLINRPQLSIVQCGVQGAHAVAEFMNKYGQDEKVKEWADKHKTMIFLEGTEDDIKKLNDFFIVKGINSAVFVEPDIGNVTTACAFQPMTKADGSVYFGKFKLLR